MAEPLVVQGASKGTSCSLLKAMTLTDVPFSNHDLMDELYSMKGIFFIHEIVSMFINRTSSIHSLKTGDVELGLGYRPVLGPHIFDAPTLGFYTKFEVTWMSTHL
jgi:hypothetical protein